LADLISQLRNRIEEIIEEIIKSDVIKLPNPLNLTEVLLENAIQALKGNDINKAARLLFL